MRRTKRDWNWTKVIVFNDKGEPIDINISEYKGKIKIE